MSPKYLSDIIPSITRSYVSRNANNIPLVRDFINYFMNTFFPSTMTEGNKLELSIQNSTSFDIFKDGLLQFHKFTKPLKQCIPIIIPWKLGTIQD